MVADLLQFAVVIFAQLILLIVHARSVGELNNLNKYIIQGCALGLPFGISCDLVLGHTLGMWSYELGFVWWFLILNGLFSYGFMIANVILLYRHSFLNMASWIILVGGSYEIVNYFFRVWTWEYLPYNWFLLITLFFLYIPFTWGVMVSLRIVFNYRFRLVPF